MLARLASWRTLKSGVLLFWAAWFTIVVITNVCDALKAGRVLPSGWTFSSGNWELMLKVTAVHATPVAIVGLMFLGVIVWEALAGLLFWRAWAAGGRGGVMAFVVALALWAAFVLADRWGRTSETIAAMALSGLSALAIGLTFGRAPALTLAVAIVWGITVIADSAQFSTAVTELSPPAYVGTALTTQTCVGFAITIASIWLIPLITQLVGWRWGFAALAPGPFLGIVAMARLRTLPDSLKLAGGRR